MTDHHREKPDRNSRGSGAPGPAKAYQAAMEAAVSIPIAMGLGWLGDRYFGTEPVLLMVGLGLGFATFVVRLTRMRGLVEEEARAAGGTEERGSGPKRADKAREERLGTMDFGAGRDDDDA